MKTRNLLACAGVAALLTACIPSVNPFYTEKDVTFDPRLVGRWAEPGQTNESWQFELTDTNRYTLTVTEENGKSGKFNAVLFKLKGQTFLDTVPIKIEVKDDQAAMVAMSIIPGHLLIRVREIEPRLKMEFFDWDWLKKFLKENPKALAHHGDGDDEMLVLTAPSRTLQKFVLLHLKEGELFKIEKPDEGMARLTNAPPSAATPAK